MIVTVFFLKIIYSYFDTSGIIFGPVKILSYKTSAVLPSLRPNVSSDFIVSPNQAWYSSYLSLVSDLVAIRQIVVKGSM